MEQAGHGTSRTEPGIGQAERITHATAHAERATGPTGQEAGRPRPATGRPERATSTGHTTLAPHLRATLAPPLQTVPTPAEATPVPAGAAGARDAAAVAASADRRPDTSAGGPKAAKVTVGKKLAHARVLLSRRAAQAPATPTGACATKAGKAVAFARAQLGKPCVWGAAGPGSYDCAGLTQAAWKSAGVTLPRTAPAQAGAGVPVPPAEARAGDLVFFHDDAGHVGLCSGDGMMIHAPRPGAYVREEPVAALGGSAVHSVVRPG
ncbi:C40 family peptidase [Streptomyces sp. NPDC017638]|uniref:C40 family peptidase n=1 Tax=Streptomyces sp. NPDC017638 TaxID=3365004 RepID=UPI003788B4C7